MFVPGGAGEIGNVMNDQVAADAKPKTICSEPPPTPTQMPSVGRIVQYTPERGGKGSPYPAIITHVWSDTCVNLNVITDGSYPLDEGERLPTSVVIGVGPRTWAWPARV